MTAHRDLKSIIRDRQVKTGESYTAARIHVMRERAALLGLPAEEPGPGPERVDAAVLKVNRQSARVRLLGAEGAITFRSQDASGVVPGQIVTLLVKRRWTWRDHAYASGTMEDPRIDIPKLGLEPLPLTGGEVEDMREVYENYHHPDPYTALWRKNTERPRACYDMDPIAWGAFPGDDLEDNATCDAAELVDAGDREGARELLMDVLIRDLRCIDAHAHLGNLAFDRWPERAMLHYEIGIRIGELSLPPGFDGALVWGRIYNRPFLRCLHGYGLCLWRAGKTAEALEVFERILALNPNDNQGVRFCWNDIRQGLTWAAMHGQEEAERAKLLSRRRRLRAQSSPPAPQPAP